MSTFLQEIDNPETLVFKLFKPLHIEEPPGPDLSFFEIEMTGGDAKLATPIELAARSATTRERSDHRLSGLRQSHPRARSDGAHLRQDLQQEAACARRRDACRTDAHPAQLHDARRQFRLRRLDLDSGKALGLHFSGSFLATNYAVRADVVKSCLRRVRTGRPTRGRAKRRRAACRSAARRPGNRRRQQRGGSASSPFR